MWKDVSSYSKSDKIRKVSSTAIKVDGLRITVTQHIHYPDELIMSCYDIGIDQKALGTKNMEEGQRKALDIVEFQLTKMLYAISQIKEQS